jgi:hypothetical protein
LIPTLLSALVAATCVLASARRLAFAVSPAWLDPDLLAQALEENGRERAARLRQVVVALDRAAWEHDLFSAASSADPMLRPALVNEQLRELDWRAQRWSRVPRVCASIATNAGFLLGSVAIIQGLATDANDISSVVMAAVNALTVGVAGTSFCAAVHVRANRTTRKRLAATDRLVERLCVRTPERERGRADDKPGQVRMPERGARERTTNLGKSACPSESEGADDKPGQVRMPERGARERTTSDGKSC